MNGIYWGLCALEFMGRGDALARDDLIEFVKSCWDDPKGKGKARARDTQPGGFGPFPRHDSHILSTLSALQILTIKDAVDAVDRTTVIECASILVRP